MIKILFFSLLLLTGLSANTQVINFGQLYIASGTDVGFVSDFSNTPTGEFINDGHLNIYRNFNNEGLFSYIQDTGLSSFEGDRLQNITGSVPIDLNHVVFNNKTVQPAFQLSNIINIDGLSEFNSGIIDAEDPNALIAFNPGSDHLSSSNDSYVDGTVLKVGDESFEYPIGDAGYLRPAAILTPINSTDLYSGRYLFENSDITFPHQNKDNFVLFIDDTEYWEVLNPTNDPEVSVTLSWNSNTTPQEIIDATSRQGAIHIVRWDANRQTWVDEGGRVDNLSQTVTTEVEVSGFGVFTLARVKTEVDLVIPNGFSPNDDGVNDVFSISELTRFPNFKIEIFNRWGNVVYKYSNNGRTQPEWWDGRSTTLRTINKGDKVPAGTYFFILDFNEEGTSPLTKWLYVTY